ncbi:4-oxalocrotonate tautomerase [Mycobacterium intracellulare]|uniref:tautomerase family protein n=1 Tax=Mycobacterium intracellulare TaxID=1767 RepID=UPI000BAAD183|nr:tautomerase family protein [Mycobacterium intracellulare]ASW98320.1 4-oxalocrotonate tautomerase [Mycobacterium intracellulare]PBA20109.1 4-oxalocrotonate tautomerase [Mycobacterium intracellulare]
MPLVEVTLTEGRTPEQIRALIHELTGAVERAVAAPAANIRVVVREVPATHWAAGDVTIAERRGETPVADTRAPIDSKRSTS